MVKIVELGDRAKDKITGFTGIVVAVTSWLNNCRRLTLQPEELSKDGQVREPQSFDDPTVELIVAGVFKPLARKPTGGPRPEPTRVATPR